MEISTIGRPRNVGWVRAATLLYGDWGTSKAYAIGLAIAAVGFTALVIIPEQCAAFPAKLLDFMAAQGISFLFWVPAIMVNIANQNLLAKCKLLNQQ